MQIVADSCEWLISYADKYVLLRPLTWMMKPFVTAPLEQESESSTIVFLVPDDLLRMPLAYWPQGPQEYREKVYAKKTECSKI